MSEIAGSLSAKVADVVTREKIWPERTADEKLEELRQVVIRQCYLIERLEQQVRALLGHQHGAHGELLTVLNTHQNAPLGYAPSAIPMSLRDSE